MGVVICWFRQDLRLADNPALRAAAERGEVLPLYILDQRPGAASCWWLHHSLQALDRSLGEKLCLYEGDAFTVLEELTQRFPIEAIYWNRCYEPWQVRRDQKVKKAFRAKGVECRSFKASLLWEPWEVLKSDGTPYKVFTPFYQKGCLRAEKPRDPLPKPKALRIESHRHLSLKDFALLPKVRWDQQLEPHWEVGEEGAQRRLRSFMTTGLCGYQKGRDFPGEKKTSRLSPSLHFGEVSPHQLWDAAQKQGKGNDLECFCRELGWREFSYSLLYHFPSLERKNLQEKFDHFPWKKDKALLKLWQRGLTGYPIVDAGMRELWQTGYMHNRVRMVVASFLVKNLLLHWHEGERWFWDCLVDADRANNSVSWQWVAGCGADAAPYFRVFNPVTQGQKFDPEGHYTRHYVPELRRLPKKYLFCPWEAPSEVLEEAGLVLGEQYPAPLVDVKRSRERALEAFHSLKERESHV